MYLYQTFDTLTVSISQDIEHEIRTLKSTADSFRWPFVKISTRRLSSA